MVDFNCSDVPKEMLDLIAEHAASVGDYVRFRGVCSLFNSVVIEKGNFSPDTFPWLMLPQLVTANNVGSQRFFDLSMDRFYNLNWPLQIDSICWGSPYGWVVLLHHDQVQIINPVTSNQVALPRLSLLLDHEGDALPPFQLSFLHRVVLCVSSPAAPTPADRFMVTVVSPDGSLFCAKPTDTQWRLLKMGGRSIHEMRNGKPGIYHLQSSELVSLTTEDHDILYSPPVWFMPKLH